MLMHLTVKLLSVVFAFALILSPLAAADQASITIPHNGRATVLTLDLKQNDNVSFSWTANASVTFQINDASGNNYLTDVGQTGNGNWNVVSDNSYVFNFRNTNGLYTVTVQWTINHNTPISVTTAYLLVGIAFVLVIATIFIYTMNKKHTPPKTSSRGSGLETPQIP
jgi:hypothetical protein